MLAIAIRQNPDIKGIVIGQEETKVLQYADDTTATLADVDSAKSLFKLMEIFKNISGLNINSSKTEGMWIGSFRGKMEEPFSIKWPTTPIKALGVYFTYDTKLLKEKNFIERLNSIKKLINIWSYMVLKRPISLRKSNNNQILLDLEVCLCLLCITNTKRSSK